MDLVALNIQRGRDHGLRGYNDYRQECQIGRASSFEDLRSTMSGEAISKLRRVYNSVDDIDLFAGAMMETPEYQGSYVGRTFLCLIGDTFARLKKGDRFFYDLGGQSGSFTGTQLREIRKASMARLICDNADRITTMQRLAFQLPTFGGNTCVLLLFCS